MALELEELRKQLEGGVGKNRVQRRKAFDTEKTPPPKRAAASPTTASTKPSASKSKTTSPATPPPQSDSDSEEEGLTEAAKQQRLRRLCERKPSGRLNVPVEVHEAWKCGGPPRDDLMKLLEDANFKKAQFLQRVVKSKEKVSKKSARTKRGWYTVEAMRSVLKWSKSYAAGVVKFCEKPGNEKLIKRDKYNKKIKKYYVQVEEDDEDLSEEEERERQEDVQAQRNDLQGAPLNNICPPWLEAQDGSEVKFNRLGHQKPENTEDISSSDDEGKKKKKKCEQFNSGQKDCMLFDLTNHQTSSH
ncbi:unnamed protein product [Effrenium voratum]|uniref:Uncharacterized protein n=1 Tax=Effrenium voratum TaxID=2562239 RepID=A0AA36JQ67_9DINO|nr:unnamed protein product [Effrenium voratum]